MKKKTSSERRMIVEVVATIAGKMTGNFEDAECDGTTFFKMASERGKRSEERKRRKDVRRQEMLSEVGRLSNFGARKLVHVSGFSRESSNLLPT